MALTNKEISKAFYENSTDKYGHGYYNMYADLFARIGGVSKLLEIGVKKGNSLAAWIDIFPEASITGVDVRHPENLVEKANADQIIVTDSARSSIKEKVGTGYDIIIDDGDHRLDWQTQTFMNLRDCWTKVYVVEDIFGIEEEKKLRKRFISLGYTNFFTYTSNYRNQIVRMSGEDKKIDFLALAIFPRPFD